MEQSTSGISKSTHDGAIALEDAFSYPLSVFSNYTLYELQFGMPFFFFSPCETNLLTIDAQHRYIRLRD